MGTFIHTADTHLGYRQYHEPERERDYQRAFAQVLDTAIDADADAVVHAGDFFHDSRPSTTTIKFALDQLSRLADHNIEFLGVVGNHDSTRDDQWIDIFGQVGLATHLDTTPHVTAGTAFYGIDHVGETERSRLTYEFEPHTTDTAVLVAHGLFTPVSPYGNWDLETVLDSSPIAFDAVLLGDDHDHRLDRIDGTIVTYAGSPERTATDQTHDRVCNRITTHPADDPPVRVDPVPLDTRPHVHLDLRLEDGQGPERIRRAIDTHDIADAVVAITVRGDGEPIAPADLESYGRDHGAFVVRVSDRRELDTDELSVDLAFGNPDDVLRDRISDLGLSVAATDIERHVRDTDGVPKSNLAGEIEAETTTRIDESPEDFTPVPDTEPEPQPPDPTQPPVVAPADRLDSPGDTAQPASGSTGAQTDTADTADTADTEPAADEPEPTTPRTGQLRFDDLDT